MLQGLAGLASGMERNYPVVEFKCTNCGAELEADSTAVGRKATCYKCQTEMVVPMPDYLPRTACPNCETEIDLTADQAGMIIKCPKCGTAVQAPSASGAGAGCGPLGLVGLVGFLSLLVYFIF
jgi:predicted Zn finger-like uncharacterized protein